MNDIHYYERRFPEKVIVVHNDELSEIKGMEHHMPL